MIKILLLAVIIWLLYRILRGYANSIPQNGGAKDAKAALMVQCDYCGVHVPQEESLTIDGKHYCCESHSRHSDA